MTVEALGRHGPVAHDEFSALLARGVAGGAFDTRVRLPQREARVPIVVDSSKWEVLLAGLRCVQGRGLVNSISLKEGEAEFLAKARTVQRYLQYDPAPPYTAEV